MPDRSDTLDRTIVFDFDGVLVDSEPVHGRGIQAAAAALGLVIREANPRWYVGYGDAQCFHRIAAANGRTLTDQELATLVALKAEAFSKASRDGTIAAFAGATDLVRAAAAVGRIALCSGSCARDIQPLLVRLEIAGCFAAIVTADDVSRTKPDPEGYLLAARRLRVDPGLCTAIEDSPAGIAAARAAGYRVIAVQHSFPPERLCEAHTIARSIADVGPLIRSA